MKFIIRLLLMIVLGFIFALGTNLAGIQVNIFESWQSFFGWAMIYWSFVGFHVNLNAMFNLLNKTGK